ncbi:uncharacterized protein L203_102460 [Cryptococcus depauperatus CBS 7841]|uniref:J domain-containing protein n=1 Tax=Cryptococcus depauperatus CBS 7841 TaxID=1295531 RepID=A0AAJ8JRY3_9TREE
MAPILSDEEAALDPYALLELETGASFKDAQKAFRKKSLKYHPDKNPTPEAASIFYHLSLSLGIFEDQAKRNYVDTRLEASRRMKEKHAQMNAHKKAAVDALVAREEAARRAKTEQVKRRQQDMEEEAIKDAGRRMLEEAQKRMMRAAAMPPTTKPSTVPDPKSHQIGEQSRPNIGSEDLTLILTLPSTSTHTSSSFQVLLSKSYGPISHLILPSSSDQPALPAIGGKKKKAKGRKAVVEFAKENWGGCYACWRDYEDRKGLEGVKVKWGKGEIPAWVQWAELQKPGKRKHSALENGETNGHGREHTLPSVLSQNGFRPSFQNERENLEAEIRRQEKEE